MASRTGKNKEENPGESLKSKHLLSHKSYFEGIIENLPDAVAIFDHNGIVTRINAAFTAIFGYGAEEAIGRNISNLMAPPERIDEADGLRYAISKGETINRKTVRLRKDGSRVNVAMKSAPVIVEGEVAGFFVIYRDITSEKMTEERLIQMAITDSLTGLFNRRHFFELSKREFARSRRNGTPLVLLMIDIDHFKKINDTYGHQVGDSVLESLAALIRALLRTADVFGRIGGEEFAVLLPETILEHGIAVAERLRNAVERMQIDSDRATLSITVSIGVASGVAGSPGFDKVLAEADRALYRAKCEGRNRVLSEPTGVDSNTKYTENSNNNSISEKQAGYAILD